MDRHLKEIKVGLLLGDGNMQTFSKTSSTWIFRILQRRDNHFEYIKHLREILDSWTVMPIRENNEKNKAGKVYKKWYFNILSFEQFTELGNAFYKLDVSNGKRKKVLPI